MFGHLLFVVIFLGVLSHPNGDSGAGATSPASPNGVYLHPGFYELLKEDWRGIGIAFLALWVSHGISYLKNFIQAGEYKRVTAKSLFVRPYGRVAVMHLTILLGAVAVMGLGMHVAPLALLVVLKIIVDLIAHLWERKKFQKAQRAR